MPRSLRCAASKTGSRPERTDRARLAADGFRLAADKFRLPADGFRLAAGGPG